MQLRLIRSRGPQFIEIQFSSHQLYSFIHSIFIASLTQIDQNIVGKDRWW